MIQDIKRQLELQASQPSKQLNGEETKLELVDIYHTLKDIAMLTNYSQLETKKDLQRRLHKIYEKLSR